MRYYEDPILGKGRAADVSGGTGSADYVGGTRIAIGGETISFVNSATIQNVTGTSVTLEPDTAYKITATASAVTLNANVPEAGKWAYEGHAEIFVAGTGYIVTGANVVLANALESDAVNNCVLRFHDGTCIIDVEDHVYGYVVTSISGTTQGTLPYGITSATQEYIAFDATTNGSTIDLSGSTANSEKHLVGNGYTSTTLTGAVDCGTSKFTVANLALSDVQVTGGTMTLGDAYIPSGSTVAVSGGGLAVEKVVGAGSASVIDLGYDSATQTGGTNASCYGGIISGVTIGNGRGDYGGGLYISGGITTISDSVISGCYGGSASIGQGGGAFYANNAIVSANNVVFSDNTIYPSRAGGICLAIGSTKIHFSSCTFSGNANTNGAIVLNGAACADFADCSIHEQTININVGTNSASFTGSNLMLGSAFGNGKVTISSGAILDLTGNTNATPIAPGGGIVFKQGGATVLVGSGTASSSYMMDNMNLPAGAKLTNTAVIDLGGGNCLGRGNVTGVELISGYAYISGGAITSNVTVSSSTRIYIQSGTVAANGTTIKTGGYFFVYSGCTASNTVMDGGYTYVYSNGTANDTTVNGGHFLVDAGTANSVTINSGGTTTVARGGIENEPVINSGGSLFVSSGGSALEVTSNTGAIVTVQEGGYITYKE